MELRVRPGVVLREFEEEHAAELFRVTDHNRTHLRRWLPWLDATRCEQDSLQFIRAVRKRVLLYFEVHFGIWVDGRLGGVIGTHQVDRVNGRTSVGYWLDQRLEGRGIVTACVATMLDHLFGELGLHKVMIQCATGNARSRAIPVRLGFTSEGVSRENEWLYDHYVDHDCFSMLEDEWRVRFTDDPARRPGMPDQ
ncbi:MAG: GNAT family N-acetyltransferase [Calditrichaeota bacterium]|nr:GNAT family N-acetyltransferase [Candidatus Cloacimonadota bacterium]MCA9787354.1 GNAT family N-acetyltransferase [Candidatus Cloacimonadota bacterium]MCB1046937.1 GNAT family N-acetyltransferase [Calditrichota bacterium]MCB9472552.1 GNAT family N-acetyltransferase [Candidatus Delongbacteria bacterium]